MIFDHTKSVVRNRGKPPDEFLEELVNWGKTAPEEIFAIKTDDKGEIDIFTSVRPELGPWQGILHRRASLLEVMRVLAGFESSWNWNEGVDVTNSTSVSPDTIEAGAWQVSANSTAFGDDLGAIFDKITSKVTIDSRGQPFGGRLYYAKCNEFQRVMKSNHPLAMEYIARLLRHTVRHNGPAKRKEINPYLSRDSVNEFMTLLSQPA